MEDQAEREVVSVVRVAQPDVGRKNCQQNSPSGKPVPDWNGKFFCWFTSWCVLKRKKRFNDTEA
jgi:hypothetical protein